MLTGTTRRIIIALALSTLLVAPGCKYFSRESEDQLKEANKIQGEADQLAAKVDDAYTQATKKEDDIKAEKRDRAKIKKLNEEEVVLYDQAINDAKSAAEKYDQAGKLKIDEKYKQYLDLRAQLMRKQGAHLAALKEMPTARTDTTLKSTAERNKKLADIRTRSDKLKKEVDDLKDQADKMQKENGDKFKAKSA